MIRNGLTKAALVLIFCFIGIISSAAAENWVRVVSNPGGDPSFVDIDTDSIRKGDDGLVYFNPQEDLGVSPSAVDCQQRLYYVIGDGSWDWKKDPYPIKPDSYTAKEADFVCSR